MSSTVNYFLGDELESLQIWWTASGSLVDFSASHAYSAKLIAASDQGVGGYTDLFVTPKTTGFTGAAGSGVVGNGTPNLTVDWATTGELNNLTTPGLYLLQISATRTSDSRRRTAEVRLQMLATF